jgi:Ca-activated chloride channel family protein
VVSKLDADLLEGLAKAGQGTYRLADYRDADTREILKAAAVSKVPAKAGDERTRIWNERYWLPVVLIMALLLPQLRNQFRARGRTVPKGRATGEARP